MKVFVYGSLCQHQENHHFLKEGKLISEQAFVKGKLYSGNSYYPLLLKDSSLWSYGELYEVDEELLTKLDVLEGYIPGDKGSLFARETCEVFTEREKGPTKAYVYYWLHEADGDPVPFNDWKVYQMIKDKSFYYFGYGSCMDDERLIAQGVNHLFTKIIGKGVLTGYRLGFSHHLSDGARADIIEDPGKNVEGVVYEISLEALEYLYTREGVKTESYRPTIVHLALEDGSTVPAISFTVLNKEEDGVPPFHYAQEIHRGGSKYLSASYMNDLEQRFLSDIPGREFYQYLQKRSALK